MGDTTSALRTLVVDIAIFMPYSRTRSQITSGNLVHIGDLFEDLSPNPG